MRFFTTLVLSLFFTCLNAQMAEPVVQFGHVGRGVSEMTFSPDGTMLATTDGAFLKLWDVASGLEFRAFARELYGLESISNISFSPDNNQIIFQANRKIFFHSIADGGIEKQLQIEVAEGEELEDDKEPSDEDVNKLLEGEKYQGAVYSNDGSFLVTATDSRLEIFNNSTNQLLNEINIDKNKDSTSTILKLIMRNLGNSVSISSSNKEVFNKGKLYDVQTGKEKYDFVEGKKGFTLTRSAFSPDGKNIVVAGIIIDTTGTNSGQNWFKLIEQFGGKTLGEVLYVYDVQTGNLVHSINYTGVTSLDFSPDGSKMLTGHFNHEIKVWDTKNWKQIFNFRVAEPVEVNSDSWFDKLRANAAVGAAIFFPDGKSILARGENLVDESLVIWDAQTGEKIRRMGANIPPIKLEGQTSASDSIVLREFEEEDQTFMSLPTKYYKGFRILDLASGQVPHAFSREDSIVFSPMGNLYLFKSENGELEIYEPELHERITILQGGDSKFSNFVFDYESKKIAGTKGNTFKVWDTASGQELWENTEHEEKVSFLAFDPSGDNIVSVCKKERNAVFWSINDKIELNRVKEFYVKGLDGAQEKAGKVLGEFKKAREEVFKKVPNPFNRDRGSSTAIIDKAVVAVKLAGFINSKGYYDVDFSPEGKIAAIWSDNLYSVRFFDLERGKELRTHRDARSMFMQKFLFGAINPEEFKASMEEMEEKDETEETVQLPSNGTEYILKQLKDQYNLRNLSAVSPDYTLFAKATKSLKADKENHIIVIPVIKERGRKKKLKLKDSDEYQEGLTFSTDGKLIAASSRSNNKIRIWNSITGEVFKTLEGHSGKIAFGPKGKTLISSGWDRQIKIWDIEKNEALYTFIGIKGTNDYIILLPSGYYTTSRKNSKAVAFRKGRKVYPFDQFDLQFQRPDKVLEVIGQNREAIGGENPNEALVTAFEQAYQKRLQKLNFSEDMFNKDFQLPEIKVDGIPVFSKNKNIQFQIKGHDDQYKLAVLNVYVNDVPVYGQAGKNLRSKGLRTFTENIKVELSNGENKIQISTINEKGAESLKATYTVNYTGTPVKPNMYFITLGTADFLNGSDLDLTYPEKDLKDVTQLFMDEKKGKYGKIHHYPLLGKDFTVAKFAQIEAVLKNAKVDDEVFIFIATHGLLDANFNYYLGTFDIDFNNPKLKGLSYERLEKVLDITPSRKKVVFIDACHAGEVDLSNFKPYEGEMSQDGEVKFRKFRSTSWEKMGLQNSFELMKSLFVDLRRGTGATVIASAGGAEAAIEGPEWNNSVFIYSLFKALKENKADLNNDDIITISELQTYLPKMVKRLTDNVQQPTFRIENLENDWRVW